MHNGTLSEETGGTEAKGVHLLDRTDREKGEKGQAPVSPRASERASAQKQHRKDAHLSTPSVYTEALPDDGRIHGDDLPAPDASLTNRTTRGLAPENHHHFLGSAGTLHAVWRRYYHTVVSLPAFWGLLCCVLTNIANGAEWGGTNGKRRSRAKLVV